MKLKYTTLLIFIAVSFGVSAQYSGGAGSGYSKAEANGKHLTNYFQTNGNWSTPGNWLDATVPAISEEANIAALATLDGSYTYPAVTIASGAAVTISSGNYLTVTGVLTNNNGNNGLVIKDGGSLLNNTAGINATVERLITANRYHYVASPVQGATAGSIFPPATYLRWYDETQPAAQWTNMVAADVLLPVAGYSAFIPAGTGNTTVPFAGTLQTGSQSVSGLSYTNNGSVSYDGYHLLGNPYSSAIDIDNENVTLSNLTNTFYFWDPSLNSGAGAYAYYTKGSPGAGINATNFIPVAQGFFVQTTSGNGSLTFTDAARANNAQPFYKNSEQNLLRLKLESVGYSDEAIVRYLPEATIERDAAFDAIKLKTSGVNNLYTKSAEGIELAINTYGEVSQTPDIQLYTELAFDGNYTMTFTGIEGLTGIGTVTLIDNLSGIRQELGENPVYIFTGSEGEALNRFKLNFSAVGIDEKPALNIGLYVSGNEIHLQLPEFMQGRIELSNLAGQILLSRQFSSSGDYSIQTNLSSGIYFVKINTEKGTLSRKVFVK